jgi:hypothetical protein
MVERYLKNVKDLAESKISDMFVPRFEILLRRL